MQRIQIISFLLFAVNTLLAQNIQINGYIQDRSSSEKLIGATIYIKEKQQGTISNDFGFFSLSVPKSKSIHLHFSFIGYQSLDTILIANKNLQLTIKLHTKEININEIVVSAKNFQKNKEDINKAIIPMLKIKSLPSLTGEADVLKTYQLMPGISMGSEANNGLYVRGGNVDQNLVLLDDIPMYSLGHIAGFVSIFDENAINSMKIIKGAFPARYGGRLSSIVDIRMKDGDMQHIRGNVSIGAIDVKFSTEGPIVKDKVSFFISVRKSLTDLYLLTASRKSTNNKTFSSYAFYDINAKIHFKQGRKNNFYLSFYSGKDLFRFGSDITETDSIASIRNIASINQAWGNQLIAVRWNHIWSPKLFSNLIVAGTHYFFNINSGSSKTNLNNRIIEQDLRNTFDSHITDKLVKLNFEYYLNNCNTLRFGGTATLHKISPGVSNLYFKVDSSAFPDSIFTKYRLPHLIDSTWGNYTINSIESNCYAENSFVPIAHLKANIGVYAAAYRYEQKSVYSIEPRFSINYNINKQTSIKGSFTQMSQFLHMISSVGSGMPSNLWIPATEKMPVEKSLQTDISFTQNFSKTGIKLETGIFYKHQTNLIDLKSGETLGNGSYSWQGKTENNGSAQIYGMELLLRKETGRASGWIAYTLSKNYRKFAQINKGLSFPFTFDRRHDFSLVFMYKIKPNIQFSATWLYASGNWMSLGSAKYPLQLFSYSERQKKIGTQWLHTDYEDAYVYSAKNNYQLPAYHRLDIAFNFKKEKKHGTRTWSLGVYNLYNRQNAYYVYYDHQNGTGKLKLYQFSLIPIFPSFSYKFNFH